VDRKKLREMAKDPRFISGIYNYCDRWCERCPLTSRCLNYAMQQEDDDDPASRDIRNQAFWDKLHSIFQMTRDMIAEDAEELGIDLSASDLEEAAEEQHRKRAEAESHQVARAARRYGAVVDEWFEANEALFEEKRDQLNSALRMGLPGADPAAEAASLKDAVEVIRWYQHQIYVKLMRALHRDHYDDELKEMLAEFPSDADGSAKVALIAMDRSLGAWGTLRGSLSAAGDSILDILVRLDRLRRRVEETFPQARTFVRPGFDAPVPPPGTE